VALGQATEIIKKATDELKLPDTVQGSFQGTARVFRTRFLDSHPAGGGVGHGLCRVGHAL